MSQKAWLTTGPTLLNSCINEPITILPSIWIFPVSFKTLSTPDHTSFIKKALVFTNSGFESPHAQDLKSLPQTFKKYINHILYV